MITEDQLEQLAIQWFQDTGWNYVHGAVIAPEGVAAEREALRTLAPALSHGEKEEDGRLGEAVRIFGSRQISRQSVAREVVGYRDSPKMLKPPWWAASLLLQHMVDELTEGRTLTESDKVEFRTHGSYRLRKSATRVTKPGPRMCRPFRAWNPVGDGTQGAALGCRMVPRWGVGEERGKPLNKERRYPIALTMRGPWGSGLPRFMGFPWASADGFRRSLGRMPCWCERIERRLKP
jgi:hypothetical protein